MNPNRHMFVRMFAVAECTKRKSWFIGSCRR